MSAGDDERRPGAGAAPHVEAGQADPHRVPPGTDTLPWARRLIDAGRTETATLPRYGDPAWSTLPDASPAKVAAVVIAAECWRIESHPATIADQLRGQLAAEHIVAEQLEDEGFAAMAAGVRAMAAVPTHVERRDRERRWVATGRWRDDDPPRSDYPGRAGGAVGVDWESGKWLRDKVCAA